MAFISGTGSLFLYRSSTTKETQYPCYRHTAMRFCLLPALYQNECFAVQETYSLFFLTSDPTSCSMMRGAWWWRGPESISVKKTKIGSGQTMYHIWCEKLQPYFERNPSHWKVESVGWSRPTFHASDFLQSVIIVSCIPGRRHRIWLSIKNTTGSTK